MGWRINRYNRRSSKKYGWDPKWFNHEEFDDTLEHRIREFQKEHDLVVDGMVGPATHRRLEVWRESLKAASPVKRNYQTTAGILVKGKLEPCKGLKIKQDLLKSKCYRRSFLRRKPNVIVTHWDVCTSAASCKRVLEKRNISTHFVIDNDGTIYQLVDTNNIAWHAKGANNRSIGVDISTAYYIKYQEKYVKMGYPVRPVLKDSIVHGRKLNPHLGFTNNQLESYELLLEHLSRIHDIPLDYPKNDDGSLCTTVYPDAVKGKFKGVINHYNLTRNKIDTAGLKLDKIIDRIKEKRS